jgi:predicted DsbA family dithiol-disulfide isomerase
MKLDIISDPICPWCYIGKTWLFQALEAHPDHPFEIEWHPFFLNLNMPAQGMDRLEYLETKFGGKENAFAVYQPIAQAASEAGLDIEFDKITRTPNTMDAHRLIHWAGIEGVQTPVASSMFKAYFEQGRDISDHDTLCDIADSCDMDAAVVRRLLTTEADKDVILEKDDGFRGMGVKSVPTFIVGGRHAVPGAQRVDLWNKVILDIQSAHEPN